MYSLILHGRRSLELQKWRNLRFALNHFQNESAFASFFSSASDSLVSPRNGRKVKTFTVSYLVGSLGLSAKLAESISRKVSSEGNGNNPDSVLSLFRSHGFTDSQISNIVTSYPRVLMLDAEKSLAPKLQFLQSRGASSSEVTGILSKAPKILGKKGEKTISRYYDFVKEIIEADKSLKFEKLCQSSLPQGQLENKIRNVSALRELGVPQKRLFHLLITNDSPVCGKEKFEESLKKVVEMGFDPTALKFVEALRVLYAYSDKTIEERVCFYGRLGLSVGDVWEMFKKCPFFLNFSEKKIAQTFETLKKCGLLEEEILSVFKTSPRCIGTSEQGIATSVETFIGLGFSRDEFAAMVKHFPSSLNYSAETVKKKSEFVVNQMKWPLKAVALFPQVLGYSFEKRIVPRCNVIKALLSRGLLRNKLPPLSTVLAITDQAFLNKYVKKLDDEELVNELMGYLHQSSCFKDQKGL